MPPHYYIPTRRHTSSRHTTSEINALGYDPDGRLTQVVQHLFGTWSPHVVCYSRFSGKYCAPPRYGPPTAAQLPWLPSGFIQKTSPPCYGSPCTPYLPPPLNYNSVVFSALVSRPRRGRQHIGGKLVEENAPVVPIAEGVWNFEVFYWTGRTTYEFTIPTNMEWNLFERLAQVYLGITDSGSRVCYRVIRGGVSEELRCLRSRRDWESVLHGITTSAGEGHYEAVEIHDSTNYFGLSNATLKLNTYCFKYPSVDDLLRQLGSVGPNGDVEFTDAQGRQGLRIAGMYNIDDFTRITPLELCLVSRIWPEKISVLFALVEEMIHVVHSKRQKDIDDMAALLQEYEELRIII